MNNRRTIWNAEQRISEQYGTIFLNGADAVYSDEVIDHIVVLKDSVFDSLNKAKDATDALPGHKMTGKTIPAGTTITPFEIADGRFFQDISISSGLIKVIPGRAI